MEREIGPNETEMKKRLQKQFDEGMKNIHFDWADEGLALSPEEKAIRILQALDEMESIQAMTPEERMKRDIRAAYEDLHEIMKLCQCDIRIFSDMTPEQKDMRRRISHIFAIADFAALWLGNYIAHEEHQEIRKKVKEKLEKEGK